MAAQAPTARAVLALSLPCTRRRPRIRGRADLAIPLVCALALVVGPEDLDT